MVVVKKLKADNLPKRKRTSVSRFEGMPEWAKLKKIIDNGIEAGAAISIEILKAEREAYGIDHPRTIPRFLEKYIAKRSLPYKVKTRDRDEKDLILITHPLE